MFKTWFSPKEKKSTNFINSLNLPNPFVDIYDIGTNYTALTDYYTKNVIAFRCINMISSSIASVNLKVVDYEHNIIALNHPICKLLKHPNKSETYYEFMEKIVSNRLINGNVYIMTIVNKKNNLTQELHVLKPDRIIIIPGNGNLPSSYKYSNNKDNVIEFPVNQITGESQIIHIKNFNPIDDWYGLSSLNVARNSIEQYNQSGEWNKSMLKNGARPSGALVVKDSSNGNMSLSTEQYVRLKSQIDEYYSGAANAGRPLLLEGGLEWKEMSLSPKDMDFISTKNSTARDIALTLGVPPQLLGIPGDNTYSNLVEARMSLWEQTILPILNDIILHLNSKLIKTSFPNLKITYNKDELEIFTEKRQKLWQYVENASFMTVNEKRKLFGLPSKKGYDNLEKTL